MARSIDLMENQDCDSHKLLEELVLFDSRITDLNSSIRVAAIKFDYNNFDKYYQNLSELLDEHLENIEHLMKSE